MSEWALEDLHKCVECGKEDPENIDGLAGNPRKWFCSDECMVKCRQKIDAGLEEERKKNENNISPKPGQP